MLLGTHLPKPPPQQRGSLPSDMISEAPVVRMLRHRHQLHTVVAHALDARQDVTRRRAEEKWGRLGSSLGEANQLPIGSFVGVFGCKDFCKFHLKGVFCLLLSECWQTNKKGTEKIPTKSKLRPENYKRPLS